jgi:hypothetical protein
VAEHSSDSIQTADSDNCDKCEEAKRSDQTVSALDNRQIEDMDIENEARSDVRTVLNVIIPGANSQEDNELTSDNPTNQCDTDDAPETSIEEKLAAKYLSQSCSNNYNNSSDKDKDWDGDDKLEKEFDSTDDGNNFDADKCYLSAEALPEVEDSSRKIEVTREDIEEAKARRKEKERTDTESSLHSNVSTRSLGDGRLRIHLDNAVDFNTFQFWRTPLPSIDLDFDLVDGKPKNITVKATATDERTHQVYSTEMNVSVDDGTFSSRSTMEAIKAIAAGLKDTHIGSERSVLVIPSKPARGEEAASAELVQIHTASVSTVTDTTEEMVTHIGSTHVLGHQLSETTLTIVDGVVQGEKVQVYNTSRSLQSVLKLSYMESHGSW